MQLSCLALFFSLDCFAFVKNLCDLAVPCGILGVLRIFDLLLYLEKEKNKAVLLLLFIKGKGLDAILDASSAPVQMPGS